jgi:hypothetical protein
MVTKCRVIRTRVRLQHEAISCEIRAQISIVLVRRDFGAESAVSEKNPSGMRFLNGASPAALGSLPLRLQWRIAEVGTSWSNLVGSFVTHSFTMERGWTLLLRISCVQPPSGDFAIYCPAMRKSGFAPVIEL